ncbi:DUF2975 domain-containing protein [Zhihengliuella somnathii]
MIPRLVTPLRVMLVLLFAGILAVQGLMVGTVIHEATVGGDAALPLPALILLGGGCLQFIIYCVWKLVGLVRAGSIFSADAFRWVDGILWAYGAGLALWVAFTGVLGFLARFTDADIPPGIVLILLVLALVGAVVFLLIVVMRALLKQAVHLRTEMEGVI